MTELAGFRWANGQLYEKPRDIISFKQSMILLDLIRISVPKKEKVNRRWGDGK